jgi:N-terminal domain of toast_rack, DUF2154/Domain of unknown function (DUF5668)
MSQTGPMEGQPGGAPPGPPMRGPRRRSFTGPIILIALGITFLLANLLPDFDPWPIFVRYWPLILVFLGLGMIFDSYYRHEHWGHGAPRQSPGQPAGPWISGTSIAWIVIMVFFVLAVWHGGRARHGWDWDQRHFGADAHSLHDTQAVELQGAKAVSAELHLGAGALSISGGSSRLLDADFTYNRYGQKPTVDYEVSGDHGQLNLTQNSPGEHHVYFENGDDDWSLRFGGNVPIDMKINMGAGEGNLQLNGVNLNRLDIQMGVGELHLDLTGERKSNLEANIQGGVGSATIHLPRAVGVHVNAEGGIGSVNAHGLKRDGDAYENDAYGKSPVTIDMTIHGGVGSIDLDEN